MREYFPETLYVNPSLITNGQGKAELALTLADSITTWRVSMSGSTSQGSLGSGSEGNALLVAVGRTLVLMDCGFGLQDTLACASGSEKSSLKERRRPWR